MATFLLPVKWPALRLKCHLGISIAVAVHAVCSVTKLPCAACVIHDSPSQRRMHHHSKCVFWASTLLWNAESIRCHRNSEGLLNAQMPDLHGGLMYHPYAFLWCCRVRYWTARNSTPQSSPLLRPNWHSRLRLLMQMASALTLTRCSGSNSRCGVFAPSSSVC